jgi:hypothetical protein
MGGVQGLAPVCMCACFLCRVVIMVYFVTIPSCLAACSDVVTGCNARVECVYITCLFAVVLFYVPGDIIFLCY